MLNRISALREYGDTNINLSLSQSIKKKKFVDLSDHPTRD
jgi:hypothetical protein